MSSIFYSLFDRCSVFISILFFLFLTFATSIFILFDLIGAVHHEPPRRPSNLDNLEFSASDSQDDSDYDFDAYSHDSSVSDENVAENMSHTKANLTNGNNAEPKSKYVFLRTY